jgi:transketolase
MATKKKSSTKASGASIVKAIAAAEKAAAKTFADWGKSVNKAITSTEKAAAAAARKSAGFKKRSTKILARIKKARSNEVKVAARNARKAVLTQLSAANDTLKSARASHATSKAAHKLFTLVEKGMHSGMLMAEKAAAKAAKPKRRRRRRKQAV